MDNYNLGCCKRMKTTNYRANIFPTRINKEFLISIQLKVTKSLSDYQISNALKKQKKNIYQAFLDEYKKETKWLLSPEAAAKEVAEISVVPGFLTRLTDLSKPVCISFGFNLKELYDGNYLEKKLILEDYHSRTCNIFLNESTLMFIQVIQFLRDYPGTPYLDLIVQKY